MSEEPKVKKIVCPECGKIAKNSSGLHTHFRLVHPDSTLNMAEVKEVEVEKPSAGGVSHNGEERIGGWVPEGDELPTSPAELFFSLLMMKGVARATAERVTREFSLSKWMWNDAQEIASLLKGARVSTSGEWIRSFLKQYGHSVELPTEEGMEFVGGGKRSREEFFGTLDSGGKKQQEDSFGQYLRYQMWKDERRGEKESGGIDPTTSKRIGELEGAIGALTDTQSKIIEMMEDNKRKEEEERKEAEWARRYEALEQKLEKVSEGKGKGNSDTMVEQVMSLQRELTEAREKRMEDLIKRSQDQLDTALGQIVTLKEQVNKTRSDALAEEADRRERYKREMEDSGWSSRKKSAEESTMDMIKEQVVPGVISEIKEGRRLIEKAITPEGGMIQKASAPVTMEEATRTAEVMELEQQLKAMG